MTFNHLKKHLEDLFDTKENLIDFKKFNQADWERILDFKPLQNAIEKKFSETDISTVKCLENLELASYFSVSLTLMFGINMALFLEPLAKYGSETLKAEVLTNFLEEKKTGGLMITEPSFGTDAMNMETTFTKVGNSIKIKGTKHWQGLTGQADYWLVAGKMVEDDKVSKQISFCLVPQEKVQFELYETQGLKPIQYGVNTLDTEVPADNLLIHKKDDNSMIADLLHRSRMQFTGMGSGFTKRLLDASVQGTSSRIMRGKPLLKMPEIKNSIINLQSYHTLVKGAFNYGAKHSGIENDLENDAIFANAIKVTVTEMMQKSADLSIQLSGGNGFLDSNFAFHGLRDCRPFLIFEGPNAMLSNQVLRLTLLGMKKEKYDSVFNYYQSISRDNTVLNREKYQEFDLTINDLLLKDVAKKEAMSSYLINIINLMFLEELKTTDFSEYMIQNTIVHLKNNLKNSLATIKHNESYAPLEIV